MKFIFGALGAVALLVGVAASQPAEARCFWNGFAFECYRSHHFGYWHRPYWDRPFVAERPYFERHYWRGWDSY